MFNVLGQLWKRIRLSHPRRLYQYGTVSVQYGLFDDRTFGERIFDSIDIFFEKQKESKKVNIFVQRHWVDKLGNSSDRIKELEKKGYAYATEREWATVTSKAQKAIQSKQDKVIRDKVEQAAAQIKQGRSFIREALDKKRK